jgi:hypothetical protein
VNDKKTVLEIGDLSEAGVELTQEELSAVSGAMPPVVTWKCGNPEKPDEWIIG